MRRDVLDLLAVVEVVAKGLDLLLFDLLFLQLPLLLQRLLGLLPGQLPLRRGLGGAGRRLGRRRGNGRGHCLGGWRHLGTRRHFDIRRRFVARRRNGLRDGWSYRLDRRPRQPAQGRISAAGDVASVAVRKPSAPPRQPRSVSVRRHGFGGWLGGFGDGVWRSASAAGFGSRLRAGCSPTRRCAAIPRAAVGATRPVR